MEAKKKKALNIPKGYAPSDSEQYMNEMHVEFFRLQLTLKRQSLQNEWQSLHDEIHSSADVDSEEFDKAARDVIIFSSIKRLELIQQSIVAIDSSLDDIENDRYGFCRKTNRPIGLKRLLANPEAKLCIQAQSDIEKNE